MIKFIEKLDLLEDSKLLLINNLSRIVDVLCRSGIFTFHINRIIVEWIQI